MKELTLFYLKGCPYCKKALAYMDELKNEYPEYNEIPIKMVEEREEAELANSYDYYYVPCYWIEDKKIAEGSIDKSGVKKVFDMTIEAS